METPLASAKEEEQTLSASEEEEDEEPKQAAPQSSLVQLELKREAPESPTTQETQQAKGDLYLGVMGVRARAPTAIVSGGSQHRPPRMLPDRHGRVGAHPRH
jgi:hypothetical protein